MAQRELNHLFTGCSHGGYKKAPATAHTRPSSPCRIKRKKYKTTTARYPSRPSSTLIKLLRCGNQDLCYGLDLTRGRPLGETRGRQPWRGKATAPVLCTRGLAANVASFTYLSEPALCCIHIMTNTRLLPQQEVVTGVRPWYFTPPDQMGTGGRRDFGFWPA